MNEDILTIEQEIYEITVEQAGADGVAGNDGKSAYEIAVDHGFTGSEADWLVSLEGEPGQKGDDGQSASIAIGATTTLPSGSNATVTNTGTTSAAVLAFGIPQGAKGADGTNGTPATITVGTTTTLPAGSIATAVNVGTTQNAVINFGIPKGSDGASSSIDPMNNKVQRRIYCQATGGSNGFSLSFVGFNNSTFNGQDSSAAASSYVAGKETYYGCLKASFKNPNSPVNNASVGFGLNGVFNINQHLDYTYTVGMRTNNDNQSMMFAGMTDLFVGLPTAISIFSTFNDNNAVGFGWSDTDTNIQFVIKKQGTSAPFKVDLSLFTGNLTATDILARQKEVPFCFRFKLKDDKTGLDLYYKNLNNGHVGQYSLLFSSVTDMPNIYSIWYKPSCVFNNKANTPVADNFDFFNGVAET